MSTTISLPSSLRTSAPRLASPIGRLVGRAVAAITAWTQSQPATPSEAAAELRRMASQYGSQPSFAADLRAAADRHEQLHGIQ
jgi:hypothetical protein